MRDCDKTHSANIRKAEPHAAPLVSVIMPVFNAARFLRQAVDSILGQTFADFEFVIVDDGSTDGSWDLLTTYRDPRISLLRNDRNQGVTYSLNRCLEAARGELIARMDADDVARPHRLAVQTAFLHEHPSVGLLGSYARVVTEDGERGGEMRYPVSPTKLAWVLVLSNPFCHPVVMFRKSVVQKAGGYSTWPFAEDYELWLRMTRIAGFAMCPEVLLDYRRHKDQASMMWSERQEHSVAEIVREYHGTLWHEPPSDALVFGMRQILGVYPPGTRPVTRQAVDALVEAVGEFVIRNEMNGIEAEEVRRDVGGQLIRFADTCQPYLAEHAVQCGVELMKDPVCDTLLAQQGVLRARASELQHDLEAIRTSRVWRLAAGWYALRARLRRPGKRVRQAAVVAGTQGAVVSQMTIPPVSNQAGTTSSSPGAYGDA